jgi:hypothetical protein
MEYLNNNNNVELVFNSQMMEFVPITENEINIIEEEKTQQPLSPTQKAKQGRPRKYNYIDIDKASNETTTNEVERKIKTNYSSQYYQNHKEIKVICPVCLKYVQKYSIGKHQKTQYCQLVAKFKAQQPQIIFIENDNNDCH